MMRNDRFDRRLPAILEEISQPRTPEYFDDLIGLAARTRQRPAWTLLERWLPMVDVARQPAFARQVPWRPIVVLTLILLLLAASLAFVIGSQHPLPAPFGLARNGLVAYAAAGDIYTADPATGASTAIVKGPDTDVDPRWSRDGTRVAFQRMVDVNAGSGVVYVARSDGSDLIRLTPDPLFGITNYDFSPDGRQLLISADLNGIPSFVIAAADGSGIRQLDVPGRVTDAAWRPPDGSEILFMDEGTDPSGSDTSIYAVNVRDAKVRTILKGADAAGRFRGHATWSPDGSKISFGEWMAVDGIDAQTHIITANGTGDHILPIPTDAVWQAPISWSNDGTRLLAIRGYTGDLGQARPVTVPVDGNGTGLEIPYPGGMDTGAVTNWEWAPDDSSILGTATSASGAALGQVLLDPGKGTFQTPAWNSVSDPSWQRVAP